MNQDVIDRIIRNIQAKTGSQFRHLFFFINQGKYKKKPNIPFIFKNASTVIGNTVWLPNNFLKNNVDYQSEMILHEAKHLYQWIHIPNFKIRYLQKAGRLSIETEAFKENVRWWIAVKIVPNYVSSQVETYLKDTIIDDLSRHYFLGRWFNERRKQDTLNSLMEVFI